MSFPPVSPAASRQRSLFAYLLLCGLVAFAPLHAQQTSEALEVQIALDQENFSPGAIDGLWGHRTRGALRAFQEARGLTASGELDAETREALKLDRDDLLIEHTLTEADLAGPFVEKIPDSPSDQAEMDSLAYTSAAEALAEHFHLDKDTLRTLNPDAALEAGTTLKVPNVRGSKEKAPSPSGDVRVVVSKSKNSLEVRDAEDEIVFYAPVTAGSEREPLPLGDWKVEVVSVEPTYHYNPELLLDADPNQEEVSLPAGPNNPVGLVWIGIDKEHYGLHGTPEPSEIGYTESSGCVRLTNWDAKKLAHLVSAGTAVRFEE